MRFIYWTIVWHGMILLKYWINLHYIGFDSYVKYYGSDIIGLAALAQFICYLVFYKLIIAKGN